MSWPAARLAALSLTFAATDVLASGAGILSAGDPLSAAKATAGVRQMAPFKRVGNLLLGAPVSSAIVMMVVRTRHPELTSELILWERQRHDGTRLLQLSGSPRFEEDFIGATLFFRRTPETGALAQAHNGQWVRLPREEIVPSAGEGPDHQPMYAYLIEDTGLFLLRNESSTETPVEYPADAAALETWVRLSRGVWHLYWPAILLTTLMLFSRIHHKRG